MWRPRAWTAESFNTAKGTKGVCMTADALEETQIKFAQYKAWMQAIHTKAGRHCCSIFGPASGRRQGDVELKLSGTEFCVDHFPPGSFHHTWDEKTNPASKHLVCGAVPSLLVAAAPPPEAHTATLRSAPQPGPRPLSSPMRTGGVLRPTESLIKARPAGFTSPLRPSPAKRSPSVTPGARQKFIRMKDNEHR